MNVEVAMSPAPKSRYTGVVCRQCMHPVAVIRDEQASSPQLECPDCGHTWSPAPLLKV
jgi:ribosomal protein S27E